MPLLVGIGFLNYFFLLVRFFYRNYRNYRNFLIFMEKKPLFINWLKVSKNSYGYFLNRNFLGILQEFFKAVFCTIGTKRAKIGIFTH